MFSKPLYMSATKAYMRHNMAIYWIDFGITYVIWWASVIALAQPEPAIAIAGLIVGALASYRCGSFMHEIVHFSKRDRGQQAFKWAWNLGFGVPILSPSCLYDSHLDHHSNSSFGTGNDPEYMLIRDRSLWGLTKVTVGHVMAPPLMAAVRLLLNPILWLVPPLRRAMGQMGNSLAINLSYQPRKVPKRDGFDQACILLATLVLYGYIALLVLGVVGLVLALKIVALVSLGLGFNALRTLVAHRYDNLPGEPTDREGQLGDTINVITHPLIGALFAPVGLRFHALHHLLPALPYHNLAKAHAALIEALPESDAYHQSNIHGVGQAFAELSQGR